MEKSFEQRLVEARSAVSSISPQQANEFKERDPYVVFIDPRDASDIYASTGIIPGALNIKLSALNESELPTELSDRSRFIITTCQAGPMAALAAHALKKRGYDNVQFIDGGTQAWLDAGFSTTH